MFQDICFSLLVIETNKQEHVGWCCSVLLRYLAEHHLISASIQKISQNQYSELLKSRIVYHTEEFWVLAMKLGTIEKVKELHPFECVTP